MYLNKELWYIYHPATLFAEEKKYPLDSWLQTEKLGLQIHIDLTCYSFK